MGKVLDFLGTPANIISSAVTVGTVTAATFLIGNPLITVSAGLLGYAGTYLLASPKPLQYIQVDGEGQESLERNIQTLQTQLRTHAKDLPAHIIEQVEGVLETIRQVLPKWQQMDSYLEQKHTVNAIVTEYIPNILNSYLELPKSYLNRSKKQVESSITDQLQVLQTTMNSIEDAVFSGVEKKLEQQRMFLEEKFTRNPELLLP